MSIRGKSFRAFWTLVGIVTVLTWPVLVSLNIVSSDPAHEVFFKPENSPDRSPASIVQQKEATLDWVVGSQWKKKILAGTERLRLKGLSQDFEIQSILNQGNGYTGSVFRSEKDYSTDFIQLQRGSNLLLVKWQDRQGKLFDSVLEVEVE